jgi:hypothetical protein
LAKKKTHANDSHYKKQSGYHFYCTNLYLCLIINLYLPNNKEKKFLTTHFFVRLPLTTWIMEFCSDLYNPCTHEFERFTSCTIQSQIPRCIGYVAGRYVSFSFLFFLHISSPVYFHCIFSLSGFLMYVSCNVF